MYFILFYLILIYIYIYIIIIIIVIIIKEWCYADGDDSDSIEGRICSDYCMRYKCIFFHFSFFICCYI
jgi:hypothetical protein